MISAFFQRATYRSAQFFKAVGARITDSDRTLVESVLATPSQRALFDRMSSADQRHAVAVLRTLRDAGFDQPALMQAALLHDMAKSGAGVTIFHRVIIVLLEAFRPQWLARLVRDAEESFWRRPFAHYVDHPAIGAHWAKLADCHPMAVSLIRRHQSPVAPSANVLEDELLAVLKLADGKN